MGEKAVLEWNGDARIFSTSGMKRILVQLRRVVFQTIEHDQVNTAKAAAYSGMLMLFPAVIVLTALLALAPEGANLLGEIRVAFDQFLPADTMALLNLSMRVRVLHSVQVLLLAAFLSVFAGLGMLLSLMEGFRRAYESQENWGFWERRARALMLAPIVLAPLALATLLVVFGRPIEHWMINNSEHELREMVLFGWRLARWAIAMLASVVVLGAMYHFGVRVRENWRRAVPGAIAATAIWFPTTLVFGWYVSRIANYSRFYGSFGAGIATLVWLYIASFSVLLGAEINGVFYRLRKETERGETPEPNPDKL
jgi:membrane protein